MGLFNRVKVPEIDAVMLHGKMKGEPRPRLLDVREPDEHAEGMIPGAVKIPMRQLGLKMSQVAPNKSEEIVVYCRSGNRSLYSTQQLLDAGYKNVSSLHGGIIAWFREGYEIVV